VLATRSQWSKLFETINSRPAYRYYRWVASASNGLKLGSFVALTRSRKNKLIAGVCGGIAEWLGWDPTVVRILYVLASILSVAFPGILVYLVLWLVMPTGE
jgi:phage shock protein C